MKYFGFIVPVLRRLKLEIARDDQDLVLSLNSPTSTKARTDQDLSLVIKHPTSTAARTDQDITLVLTHATSTAARVDQDIILVLVRVIPATSLLAFTLPTTYRPPARMNQASFAQASVPVFPAGSKNFPIVFCVT